MQVAIEMTEKDALATHIREELGINDISQAKPIQAAIASGLHLLLGSITSFSNTFAPMKGLEYWLYGFTTIF